MLAWARSKAAGGAWAGLIRLCHQAHRRCSLSHLWERAGVRVSRVGLPTLTPTLSRPAGEGAIPRYRDRGFYAFERNCVSDGWPFAALRGPCGARSSGPSLNSLRSLRSLRSDSRDESVDEARQGARPEALCSSAAPIRPAQAPPAALPATGLVCDVPHATTGSATGQPGRARRACEAPSSTGFGARARSALRELTRRDCSTTVSEANGGS